MAERSRLATAKQSTRSHTVTRHHSVSFAFPSTPWSSFTLNWDAITSEPILSKSTPSSEGEAEVELCGERYPISVRVSAQAGRRSAAILSYFSLCSIDGVMCAPHDVPVPTCLHIEVLRRSVSTYAHVNEVDSPGVLQPSKSEIFSLTVCLLGLNARSCTHIVYFSTR